MLQHVDGDEAGYTLGYFLRNMIPRALDEPLQGEISKLICSSFLPAKTHYRFKI